MDSAKIHGEYRKYHSFSLPMRVQLRSPRQKSRNSLRKILRQAYDSREQVEFLGLIGIQNKRKVTISIGD